MLHLQKLVEPLSIVSTDPISVGCHYQNDKLLSDELFLLKVLEVMQLSVVVTAYEVVL